MIIPIFPSADQHRKSNTDFYCLGSEAIVLVGPNCLSLLDLTLEKVEATAAFPPLWDK